MTRRSSVTNRMPSRPPMTMSATDCQYLPILSVGQSPASTNAGMVNTAPAATDSPMDPIVRAMFSSSNEPFINRRMDIPMTAAG